MCGKSISRWSPPRDPRGGAEREYFHDGEFLICRQAQGSRHLVLTELLGRVTLLACLESEDDFQRKLNVERLSRSESGITVLGKGSAGDRAKSGVSKKVIRSA